MSDQNIKTGDLSQQAGVNKETIRFYERRGLLHKPDRTPGGYRLYRKADVQRVIFIKNAQALGFSLKEIQELLSIADCTLVECDEVRAIASDKLQFVRNQIESLRNLESVLSKLVKRCARSGQVNDCPIIESISVGPNINMVETVNDDKLK